MPTRRQFLAGSAVTAGLTALPAPATAAAAAPSFVIVLADDLGHGELGRYGQKIIKTPVVDRLADEGLRFTRAYSCASVCAPSRASLLTGLHSGHATVRQNPEGGPQGSLADTDVTFADLLRARGYRTGLFGKWGFGPTEAGQASHPNERGFEEFFGYVTHDEAHDYYPTNLWHNGEGVAYPQNATANRTYAIDEIEKRAVDWLSADDDRPFLALVTPPLPHSPSDVPATAPYDDPTWPAADRGHAWQVSRLDALVGRIVETLRAAGRAENTYVIVTSDNGPHEEGGANPDRYDANGPLRGYKRNLHEGGIRIPLVIWRPGTVQAAVTDRVSSHLDLYPTIAELAGVPVPSDLDGLSITGLLRGGSAPAHDHLFWYRREPGSTARANAAEGGSVTRVAEAVVRGDWKALRFAPGHERPADGSQWSYRLYDLGADAGENTDLAAARPEVLATLKPLLDAGFVAVQRRVPFGLRLEAPARVATSGVYTVTATLTNGSAVPWTRTRIRLALPSGWNAVETSATDGGTIAPGATARVAWTVTVRDKVTPEDWKITASAAFRTGDTRLELTRSQSFPKPPTAGAYLSDLPWVSATNGWGPVERDASNGKNGAGDGTPIAFGGTVYAKGLGTHPDTEIVYFLGGGFARFTALVGIDDFSANQSAQGSTIARVFGDGTPLFDSGTLTAATGPKPIDVDLTGVAELKLVVVSSNASHTHDHTSWANAYIEHL